jgi:hypothetical protein
MNATHSMDHLHAITHVSNVLNTNVKATTVAISKPKVANTSHYDPTGKEVAIISNTSFEGITFAADGSIASGNLAHESMSPDGTKLSTTSMGFENNGKPSSAEINVHNKDGSGDFKKVTMDMNAVVWNASFAISSGQVKLSTIDALTQLKKTDGVINFDKETLLSGSFTHFSTEKAGEITHLAEIDYSKAKFLGTRIVGGQYEIKSMRPDKSVESTSIVSVSPIGRLQSIETTNLDTTAAVKSKVQVGFSKVVFNARNEFDSGDINYTVNDSKATLLSKTTVTYKNTVPANSETLVYSKAEVLYKILVDYSESKFNNSKQVVNSSKKVQVYSKAGNIISSTTVNYDQHGNKIKPNSQTKQIKPATPADQQSKQTTPAKVPVKPPVVPPVKAATGDQRVEKVPSTRADGTLEQMKITVYEGDTPVSYTIIYYATDGKTVVKSHAMDLSSIKFDPNSNTVTGTLALTTNLGENTLHSQSAIQY